MALHMAATVLCSSVFVLFLLVFPVFCFSNTISFTREELLNIRQNTPLNLLPDFDHSGVLLDIVVGGAAVLFRRWRTRRWGKRAGALVKLHQRGLRTPCLASISRISALYPTKRTNSFCSPGQTGIFQTLLLCVSWKPGWTIPYRTASFIFLTFSWSDQIARQNQRGNRAAAGRASTSMRGGVQM